ncbi:MAG: potassium channel protein [Theionarchaea archaeon]|nr:potassium channel protein [Theionarchaea archaeon]
MDEEPVTVRDLLIELKDNSELAVYLAYSALMFKDRTIADEVSELEEKIDELKARMRMATMLSVRNQEDAQTVGPLLRIASAADRISNSASEIAELLQRGIEIHPIVFEALEQAEEKVARSRVSEGSELIGKSLGEADLESKVGMMVIAIRREGGGWIWGPEDEVVVNQGDVLIARGPHDGALILREISRGLRELRDFGGEEDE